jgi:hypothetical protein
LLLHGKTNDTEHITLVQNENKDGYNSFNVVCDMFGNISGNSTVKLIASNITDEKRTIFGIARMNISGTVKNYTITVIINVWDFIGIKL